MNEANNSDIITIDPANVRQVTLPTPVRRGRPTNVKRNRAVALLASAAVTIPGVAMLTKNSSGESVASGNIPAKIADKLEHSPRLIDGENPSSVAEMVLNITARNADNLPQPDALSTAQVAEEIKSYNHLDEEAARHLPEGTVLLTPPATEQERILEAQQAFRPGQKPGAQ